MPLAYDMHEYSKARYNLLENGGHWFPGATAKNAAQFDFKACLQDSPHRDKIPQILEECDRLLGGTAVQRLSQS